MRTRIILMAASIVLGAGLIYSQAVTTTAPAVSQAISAIQAATEPQQVIDAYGRGALVDRNDPALNDAYMRRMLQLGQPKIAAFPARVLEAQQPDNGLALGVIAYGDAVSGDMASALNNIVCAAANARDNVGILRDAGMLVSWYDNAPNVGKVAYTGRCMLREIRRSLENRPEYVSAYNRIKDAIAAYRQQVEDAAKKISDAQTKLAETQNLAADLDIQIRETSTDIGYRQGLIAQLNSERTSGWWTPFGGANNGWQAPYYAYGYRYPYPYLYRYDSNALPLYQQDMARQMTEEQGQIQKDVERQQSLLERSKDLQGELRAQQADLNTLRAERKLAQERMDNAYVWDPPAVDGIITPAAPPLPPPKVASAAPAGDAESAAQYRVELARMFLANGRNDLAAEALHDVINNYGQTAAATQAQQILQTMP